MAKREIQTFGKYQILERIATGGMAEIYKARLEGIGGFQRTFAIKRILPHLSQNAEYVAMLVDEAKVAGLLSHANIVQILDLGQVDGIWYIAMEYVEGRDLGNVLKKAREKGLCLPVPHTVFVTIELLKGLEYAHQRQVMRGGRPVPLNIIHRDISPPNILLSFQGEVKLTDFGIARASHKALETQSGIIKGRFDYMSPEQAAGQKDLDQRSDLFSVGVVLYEMLTGEHPFRAESELGTLDRIRAGRYVPVSAKNPDVPFTLETIVDRALRVDRNERYPSATAFKEALDKFFHDSGFIFTHSTLAAYVRGLYPGEKGPPAASSPAPATRTPTPAKDEPAEDLELDEFESDGPTRVIDQARVSDEDRPTSGGEQKAFGLHKDEATLIRPNPLLGAGVDGGGRGGGASPLEVLPTPPPADASQWADEQETQIRPSPFQTPAPVDRTVAPVDPFARPQGAVRFEEPRTVSESLPAVTPVVSDRSDAGVMRAPSIPPPPVAPPSRGGGRVLGLVLAAVALAFGLALGATGAVVVLKVAGIATLPPPRLEVVAPAGVLVTVNGQPTTGQIAVQAGQSQRVAVLPDGKTATWDESFVPTPGESRVIVVAVPSTPAGSPAPSPAPGAAPGAHP